MKKKYAIPCFLMLIGHQVISIIALIVASAMFIGDIIQAADARRY